MGVHEGGLHSWRQDAAAPPSSWPRVASPLQIRPYEPADWPAVWVLLEPVFRAGETFPHGPAINESEAQVAWVEQSQAVVVAVDGAGAVVVILPGAFRHRQLGYVDALVMFKGLLEGPTP